MYSPYPSPVIHPFSSATSSNHPLFTASLAGIDLSCQPACSPPPLSQALPLARHAVLLAVHWGPLRVWSLLPLATLPLPAPRNIQWVCSLGACMLQRSTISANPPSTRNLPRLGQSWRYHLPATPLPLSRPLQTPQMPALFLRRPDGVPCSISRLDPLCENFLLQDSNVDVTFSSNPWSPPPSPLTASTWCSATRSLSPSPHLNP